MLKRRNIVKILGMGSLCLFLLGCSEEGFILQEEETSTLILEEEVVLTTEEGEEEDSNDEEKPENSQNQVQNSESTDLAGNQNREKEIAVHLCGAVNQPGVYYFKENQRVYEGIQKAGGFRSDADQDYLNQALILEDGMKIIVPTREETNRIKTSGKDSIQEEDSVTATGKDFIQVGDHSGTTADGEAFIQKKNSSGNDVTENTNEKVDLNTADEALLCTLPGIGESRAKSIIAYREENGLFQKTEDVMKVSGIKEAAYEKIKDYVIVSK